MEAAKVSYESLNGVQLNSQFISCATIVQLSTRFCCDSALVRKQKSKYKNELDKFILWSKIRDPDGYGWRFDEVNRVFDRIE